MKTKKLDELLNQYSRQAKRTKKKDCLSDEQIAGFTDNLLPAEEREKVEKHVNECDYCLHQIASLKKDLNLIELSENIIALNYEPLKDIGANILTDALEKVPQKITEWAVNLAGNALETVLEVAGRLIPQAPLYAYADVLRGDKAEDGPLTKVFTFNHHQTKAEVTNKEQNKVAICLELTKDGQPLKDQYVAIGTTQQTIDTQMSDVQGIARFDDLSPDKYIIKIRFADVQEELEIKFTINLLPAETVQVENEPELNAKALNCQLKGDYLNAINYCKKIIALNPKATQAYDILTFCYNKTGMNEQAINIGIKAITEGCAGATVYNNLGFSYENTGRNQDAVNCYNKAIELGNIVSYSNLAALYLKMNNPEAALFTLTQALQKGIRTPEIDALGILSLKKMGNNQEAFLLCQTIVIKLATVDELRKLAETLKGFGLLEEYNLVQQKLTAIG